MKTRDLPLTPGRMPPSWLVAEMAWKHFESSTTCPIPMTGRFPPDQICLARADMDLGAKLDGDQPVLQKLGTQMPWGSFQASPTFSFGHGSKPKSYPQVNIPISTKIGSKMGGAPTPKMGYHWFLPTAVAQIGAPGAEAGQLRGPSCCGAPTTPTGAALLGLAAWTPETELKRRVGDYIYLGGMYDPLLLNWAWT